MFATGAVFKWTHPHLRLSLSNYVPPEFRHGNPERTRNTLALIASRDLRRWEVRAIILQNPDTSKHGFQYADWQFDGDDLVAVSRTAHEDGAGGAHNQHDSNYITFHRVESFRTLGPPAAGFPANP